MQVLQEAQATDKVYRKYGGTPLPWKQHEEQIHKYWSAQTMSEEKK